MRHKNLKSCRQRRLERKASYRTDRQEEGSFRVVAAFRIGCIFIAVVFIVEINVSDPLMIYTTMSTQPIWSIPADIADVFDAQKRRFSVIVSVS